MTPNGVKTKGKQEKKSRTTQWNLVNEIIVKFTILRRTNERGVERARIIEIEREVIVLMLNEQTASINMAK